MPPVPSITKAFSGLMSALQPKANSSVAPNQTYASLQPRPAANYSSMVSQAPAVPALPNASRNYSSLASPNASYASMATPNASYASMAPTNQTYSSLVPPPTPNATSVATKQPVYMPPPPAPAVPVVAPKAPQTFAEPIVAPSGATVDQNTGGVVAPAAAPVAPALPEAAAAPLAIANTGNMGSTQNYSAAAGGAPGGVSAPGGAPAMPSFEDEYLKSLRATKEEDDAQARLDELAGAAALSEANIQNQPIALPFITGQQAAVERSRAARTVPIAAQLARLQAKRQMSLEASKGALEREDKRAGAKQTSTEKAAEAAESARRFGIEQSGSAETRSLAAKKFTEDARQFGMEYALKQREFGLKATKAAEDAKTAAPTPSKALDQITLVESSLGRAKSLAGASGRSGLRKTAEGILVGSTDYTNLVAETNTLRTNVLTMMTDPTIKKFFGPQMSNADVQLMTSAGTTLNPELQSPENMKSELLRLDDLVARAKTAVQQGSVGTTGAFSSTPSQMRLPNGTVVTRQADGTYK